MVPVWRLRVKAGDIDLSTKNLIVIQMYIPQRGHYLEDASPVFHGGNAAIEKPEQKATPGFLGVIWDTQKEKSSCVFRNVSLNFRMADLGAAQSALYDYAAKTVCNEDYLPVSLYDSVSAG